MSVAQSRRTTQLTAAVILTVALIWLLVPSYRSYMGDEATLESVRRSWADPFLLTSGHPQAMITVVLTLIASLGAWFAWLRRRTYWTPLLWALAAALVALIGCTITRSLGWTAVVAVVLLLLGGGVIAYAARPALPNVVPTSKG